MRVVLHIGLEKTGTTAIQAHCDRNAGRLRAHGVLYPSGLGHRNHAFLAAAVTRFEAVEDIRLQAGARTEAEHAQLLGRVIASLREQVRRTRPAVLLLSSEHFSSRCGEGAAARLRDALAEFSGDIRVLAYLRRQDEMLLSLYSTFVKSQGTRGIQYLADQIPWFHYDALLDRWAGAFGRDRVDARIYPPRGKTLIEDFAAAAGLPSLPAEQREERPNRALDHRQALLLAKLNTRLPLFRDGRINPDRGGLVQFMEARSDGPPLSMPREARAAFLARFAASNESVRAAWFPHLPTLFDPEIPEADPPLDVTVEDAIDLAAAMWADRARLAARVAELENGMRGGRLARTARRLRARLVGR